MSERDLNNLFIVGDDDLPYLSKEAKNIACFYDIITRDKGNQKQVFDAKVGKPVNKFIKTIARKEIAFIYFYINSDFLSNYDEQDRIKMIKKRLGIEHELDKLVWNAIAELKEDDVTVEQKMLKNINKTLHGYNILMETVTDKVLENIRLLEAPVGDLTPNELLERTRLTGGLIEQCRADFKWVLDATKQLKDTFKTIEELRIAKASKGRKQKTDRLQEDKDLYKRRAKID